MRRLLFLLVFLATLSWGQGFRYDNIALSSPAGGGVSRIANPSIVFCASTQSSVANCILNPVTTFTSQTLATPCSTLTPVVLANTNTCVANGDSQGNFGAWLAPGSYKYVISGAGVTAALYDLSAPVGVTSAGVAQTGTFNATSGYQVNGVAGASNSVLHGGGGTYSQVGRVDEGADARGWAFCGGTTTGGAVTVGPIAAGTCCSGGTCRQFMVHYNIKGYQGGSPIGRLLVGPGAPSTTGLTNSFSLSENVTAPSTGSGGTAIPGLPLAVTTSNIGRDGWVFIDGASGDLKVLHVFGSEGSPSVATAPTLFRGSSFFSDLSTNLPLQQFQLTVYDTLVATSPSATLFASGTGIWVWGRNAD